MLFEHHPFLSIADLALQDAGALAAAEYGRPAEGKAAGDSLYRNVTVHQSFCSTPTVDFSSLFISACVYHAYPAFVLHRRFRPKLSNLFLSFRFCFCSFVRALSKRSGWHTPPEERSALYMYYSTTVAAHILVLLSVLCV